MKKLIFVFIVGVALVWFGMDFYKKNNTAVTKPGGRGGAKQVVVAVEAANIFKGDMHDEGVFSGSIEPKSKFQVAPKTSGRIKKVNFNRGYLLPVKSKYGEYKQKEKDYEEKIKDPSFQEENKEYRERLFSLLENKKKKEKSL